jgi:hypothetical protein
LVRSGCYGLATKVVSGEKLWRGGRPRFHGGIDAEVLQLARHGRAVDQGRQAGGKDDAAELPLISVERGAAEVVRDRIQLGQPVAAAGAAEGNRNVVVDQHAATAGEDRWAADKARPLLLVIAGGEPSHAAHVRRQLRRMEALPLPTDQVRQAGETNLDGGGELTKKCPRNRLNTTRYPALVSRRRPFPVYPSLGEGNGCKKECQRRQSGCIWPVAARQNGNSG